MALFTGRLKEPLIDYLTGKLTILFEPCEDFRQTYEELKGCEKLSLEIKNTGVREAWMQMLTIGLFVQSLLRW